MDLAPAAASAPRRTQAERRAASRARMLDAALDLVAERRSLRFTLAEVGERAGYSRGLPGQAFETKTGLIEALAHHALVLADADFPHTERGEGLTAVLATVRLLMLGGGGHERVHQAVQVMLAEAAAPGSPHRAAMAELNRVSTGYLSKQLRLAAERGEIAADIDFRSQAALILGAVRGALLHSQIEPDRFDRAALHRELERTLLAALRPATP